MPIETYQHSRRFDAVFIPAAVALVVVAAVGACVYQQLLDWSPLIYLNAVLTAIAAGAGGAGVAFAVRRFRCRNRVLAVALGIAVGVVAVSASHWYGFVRTRQRFAAGFDPGQQEQARAAIDFRTYFEARADRGWSFKRRRSQVNVTGLAVFGVWGAEALIILGTTVAGGVKATRSPFCERCGRWISGAQEIMVRGDQDRAGLRRLRDAASVGDLARLEPATSPEPFVLSYELEQCPSCEESRYLTVKKVTTTRSRKGEPKVRQRIVARQVRVGADDLEQFKQAAAGNPIVTIAEE